MEIVYHAHTVAVEGLANLPEDVFVQRSVESMSLNSSQITIILKDDINLRYKVMG